MFDMFLKILNRIEDDVRNVSYKYELGELRNYIVLYDEFHRTRILVKQDFFERKIPRDLFIEKKRFLFVREFTNEFVIDIDLTIEKILKQHIVNGQYLYGNLNEFKYRLKIEGHNLYEGFSYEAEIDAFKPFDNKVAAAILMYIKMLEDMIPLLLHRRGALTLKEVRKIFEAEGKKVIV